MVTDAFIRGIGGVLIHRVGQGWHILEAFEAPVGTEHKGLAVLRALQIWPAKVQGGPVVIR